MRLIGAMGGLVPALVGAGVIGGHLIMCKRVWGAYLARRGRPTSFDVKKSPVDVDSQSFAVRTRDGLSVRCHSLEGERAETLILCPGYRCAADHVMPIATALNSHGYRVVVFGWRGTSDDDRVLPTAGAREWLDLDAVLRHTCATSPGAVGVVGLSFGATMALIACSQGHAVDALWLDSPFRSALEVMAHSVRRRTHLPGAAVAWSVAIGAWCLRRVRLWEVSLDRATSDQAGAVPIRIVVSSCDRLVAPESIRAFCRRMGWRSNVWEVEVDHCLAYAHDEAAYLSALTSYFDEVLPHAAVSSREPVSERCA